MAAKHNDEHAVTPFKRRFCCKGQQDPVNCRIFLLALMLAMQVCTKDGEDRGNCSERFTLTTSDK